MKKNLLSLISLSLGCTLCALISQSCSLYSSNSLTFDTDGGTTYNVVETTGKQGVRLPTPEKYGCEFLGWYDNPEFSGEAIKDYYIPTGDDVLYAKWSASTAPVVSFESNGGTTYKDFSYAGVAITLPTPEKLDYTFDGWYESADFSGEVLGETYTPSESITLYAKWTQNEYPTVTFHSNGGTSYEATIINSKGINLPTPTKEGFSFDGWYETENFSGAPISGVYMPTESIDIYAKWSAKTPYTLSFNTNGGLEIESITAYEGDEITLPDSYRYGYHFEGWFDNSSFTGTSITNVTLNANATYYAKWTEIYYVYLYYNESNDYERLEYAPGSTLKIEDLPEPEEYVKRNVICPFVRWAYEDGTTATDTTVNSNIILVAKYDTSKAIAKNLVDNGDGTYTTKTLGANGKAMWIFQETESNLGTYSIDVSMLKGSNGSPGIAFRMTHSGRDYSFEDNGTSYIAAVLGPTSGALEMSHVSGGTWTRINLVALTSLPASWQNKFNNASSIINVNLKVISYSNGFAIYIDNTLAYTYTDTMSLLSQYTGTGWGIRNSTTDNPVTFSNVQSYSETLTYQNKLTDNGNGSYTTSSSTLAMFNTASKQALTYTGTFAIVKGNSGGVGLAFRMKMNGTSIYPYEDAGTQYLSAVFCPKDGALQVSMVDGDLMTYEGSAQNKFFHLRGVNCKGTTELGPIALADLPTTWQTKYNAAASGATITSVLKVIDYGSYFEVYIDDALSFTVTDAILSYFTGTGLGIRTSSTGATISNLSYVETESNQAQPTAQPLEFIIPNKEENL